MKILYNMDCGRFLDLTSATWDMIFMDPPDNLGLEYDTYVDKRHDYFSWLTGIIISSLGKAPVVWVSYYYKHDFILKGRLCESLNLLNIVRDIRTYIWRFEFGQYGESDTPNGYRPIMRISRLDWKPYMEERVPSLREKIGDLRATGRGRVPDDVIEACRVQGNNTERRAWHPTQHNEAVYRRLIRLSLPVTNRRRTGRFLDLFAGTGTCFRCTWDDMITTGVELSAGYCRHIAEEHGIKVEKEIL